MNHKMKVTASFKKIFVSLLPRMSNSCSFIIPFFILKLQAYGCAILITDHQVRNLFDIVDRAYVLGEQTIIAEGTPSEILKSSKYS